MKNPVAGDVQPKLDDLLYEQRNLEAAAKQRLGAISRDIAVKEARLAFCNEQLAKAEMSFEQRKQELEKAIAKLKDQKDQALARMQKTTAQIEKATQQRIEAAQELERVVRDVDERRAYFEQQEAEIEKATEAWSDRMKDLAAQVNLAKSDHDAVLERISQAYKQIEGLKEEKDLVQTETSNYRERAESARAIYEQTVSTYRQDLTRLREELDKLTQDTQLEAIKSAKREESLDYREKHIEVREEVIKKVEMELEMKRRRLNSDLSLRG